MADDNDQGDRVYAELHPVASDVESEDSTPEADRYYADSDNLTDVEPMSIDGFDHYADDEASIDGESEEEEDDNDDMSVHDYRSSLFSDSDYDADFDGFDDWDGDMDDVPLDRFVDEEFEEAAPGIQPLLPEDRLVYRQESELLRADYDPDLQELWDRRYRTVEENRELGIDVFNGGPPLQTRIEFFAPQVF
ncbi:Oidioi.mRNA.OKI2018_I69.chr2.g4827.t1.cds [Oikopleura dioica]|uniref:Oidioi.mRNA.OKI2018_I69.chr2.g4827.t1.cds n=1 Tax=Oikopleura dioica TaxID=34765 RepID=A0ABN7T051_OIKDI|nr:Oidioi.mRNA.OKI2018_I69.chr2.g4827.t1.cds [Oikopleura dioica]